MNLNFRFNWPGSVLTGHDTSVLETTGVLPTASFSPFSLSRISLHHPITPKSRLSIISLEEAVSRLRSLEYLAIDNELLLTLLNPIANLDVEVRTNTHTWT
jgi:hypothetical protein